MTELSHFASNNLPADIEACIASFNTETTGQILGIVDFGRIGQEVARRAHQRFGMKIVVFDPRPVSDEALKTVNAQRVDSLDELLPLCDVVSLHCARTAENLLLIDAPRLNLMKEDAYLINTVHRDIIDEQALAQALWFETIGGAALGGFDGTSRIHPDLRDCENLVIMPLVESRTGDTTEDSLIVPPAAAPGGYIPCYQAA